MEVKRVYIRRTYMGGYTLGDAGVCHMTKLTI